ncbi:MAG: flagellar export chaperone FliS [Thermodesulfobacteriota bacterium]
MTYGRGAQAYTQTQVSTTTSQKQLIVMAYDGILRFLNRAVESMTRQEIEAAEKDLVRARAVVEELAGTLNMDAGGIIARNLWNLYIFFMQKITEANLTKDPAHVEGILPSLKDLRDGWAQLEMPAGDAQTQLLDRRVAPADVHHRVSITG